ncbi:MAG: phosphocholine cytidylyltransferase family protein [Candidatus Cloacimonetes bacterium]|nr:phosphocholine cytidylyltransferase family protein [Candidatus Cloacimonadota bacterium]MCF7882513.1 phosphocholine cytidylyltransferase family protein [Candidatus Cloacimonadota bacterium]
MKAIILAAGMGKRLQKASDGKPKSMIKIGEKSIMHHQLESCQQVGIKDFVFVLGYKKDELKQHILEKIDQENAVFIENPIYNKTNTLYSLYLTRKQFDDDFIYFNADVLFQSKLLKKISSPSQYSQLLLETKSCGEEEVKMIIDDNMKILEIGKKLPIPKCAGEFIGIGKFKKEILPKFIEHLQYGVDNDQANNYFEYAVDLLAKDVTLQAVPTDGIPCIEIDFPEDLRRAREMFEL